MPWIGPVTPLIAFSPFTGGAKLPTEIDAGRKGGAVAALSCGRTPRGGNMAELRQRTASRPADFKILEHNALKWCDSPQRVGFLSGLAGEASEGAQAGSPTIDPKAQTLRKLSHPQSSRDSSAKEARVRNDRDQDPEPSSSLTGGRGEAGFAIRPTARTSSARDDAHALLP